MRFVNTLCAALLYSACAASAAPNIALQVAAPESVGFSSELASQPTPQLAISTMNSLDPLANAASAASKGKQKGKQRAKKKTKHQSKQQAQQQ